MNVSGDMYYTTDGGYTNFMAAAASSVPQSMAAFAPGSSSANSLILTNNFFYGGYITPAVFAANFGGQHGTLTLDTLTSVSTDPDGGLDVILAGTFDQAGYAQKLATASFLLNSTYVGDDINMMMLRGIAQIAPAAPAVAPEPESLALLGTGVFALAGAGMFRRRLTMRNAVADDIA